tara:strand:- start:450 stop:638 length:189 start_codon:yes stop_codon:yes gene_type:complete
MRLRSKGQRPPIRRSIEWARGDGIGSAGTIIAVAWRTPMRRFVPMCKYDRVANAAFIPERKH